MTQQSGYGTGHAIKKLIVAAAIATVMIWSIHSVDRCIATAVMLILFAVGPRFIHREIARRVSARSGFRLIAFSEPRSLISWSFNWPWWCEYYGYVALLKSPPDDEFACHVSIEGPFFATICPSVLFSVGSFDSVSVDGIDIRHEDIARRLQILRELKVQHLDLSCSPITDSELVHIQNWESLETISLSDTQVSDRGLKFLNTLKELKELNLHRTNTTPEGRNELRHLLSKCVIFPEP